jgi:hypothetical protein
VLVDDDGDGWRKLDFVVEAGERMLVKILLHSFFNFNKAF